MGYNEWGDLPPERIPDGVWASDYNEYPCDCKSKRIKQPSSSNEPLLEKLRTCRISIKNILSSHNIEENTREDLKELVRIIQGEK